MEFTWLVCRESWFFWTMFCMVVSLQTAVTISAMGCCYKRKFAILSYGKFTKRGSIHQVVAQSFQLQTNYKYVFSLFYILPLISVVVLTLIWGVVGKLNAFNTILAVMWFLKFSKRTFEVFFVHQLKKNKTNSIWQGLTVGNCYVALVICSLVPALAWADDYTVGVQQYVALVWWFGFEVLNTYCHVVLARLPRPRGEHWLPEQIGPLFKHLTVPHHISDSLACFGKMLYAPSLLIVFVQAGMFAYILAIRNETVDYYAAMRERMVENEEENKPANQEAVQQYKPQDEESNPPSNCTASEV